MPYRRRFTCFYVVIPLKGVDVSSTTRRDAAGDAGWRAAASARRRSFVGFRSEPYLSALWAQMVRLIPEAVLSEAADPEAPAAHGCEAIDRMAPQGAAS